MKRNEIKTLANKSITDLQQQLADLQGQLTTAYLQKAARKLKNTSSIKNLKADIARVKTVINAQEVQG